MPPTASDRCTGGSWTAQPSRNSPHSAQRPRQRSPPSWTPPSLAGPLHYQRHVGERDDPPAPLRTLHFGPHHEGQVTFLVYPPDDLALVVRIQRLGD